MKNLLKITLITVLILTVSCQREKLSTQSVVDTETAQQAYTDLDKWIETNITLPLWHCCRIPLGQEHCP